MPDPDQNGQSVYLFSNQNGPKTTAFWAVRTYMAYVREYQPPRQILACSALMGDWSVLY